MPIIGARISKVIAVLTTLSVFTVGMGVLLPLDDGLRSHAALVLIGGGHVVSLLCAPVAFGATALSACALGIGRGDPKVATLGTCLGVYSLAMSGVSQYIAFKSVYS